MRAAIILLLAGFAPCCEAGVVAMWLFDEQAQSYPSSVLGDSGPNSYFVALGRGARLVRGRFGNALQIIDPEPLEMRGSSVRSGSDSAVRFGLVPLPIPPGRKVQPMWWGNSNFAALMTSGEKHLRTGGYANATDTRLNLGAFDWTVEFWLQPESGPAGGVVFEIGAGPRGENDKITRLSLAPSRQAFELTNQPSGTTLKIPTDRQALQVGVWRHLAFVYSSGENQLRHYVDGRIQPLPSKARLAALAHGDEAYFSIGRDGIWERPLPGKIDELRISDDAVYGTSFQPPASLSRTYSGRLDKITLQAGPPLLFGKTAPTSSVVDLGSRKHVFIDDALIARSEGIDFVPNPPRRMEKIADDVHGHLTMVEDEFGLLRIYYRGPDDYLAVMTSRDGVHWEKPDTGHGLIKGARNIVLPQSVGLGVVIVDPNGPPETRYKYFSGMKFRSMYLFTSRDGFWFERNETAALPFSAGSQSAFYYDDQRQIYVAHHRSDYGATPAGTTRRRFVLSEVRNPFEPWPFDRVSPDRTTEVSKTLPTHADELDPWFLDNGPLAAAGLGIDLPTIMATDDRLDPVGTDIYVTTALKYAWAPDTYVAFPAIYFHYNKDGPEARTILGSPARKRGSGVVETQVAVSRDGLDWKRYPRPAYVPIGGDGSNAEHMIFMTHGLVRRGNEIWQFIGGHGGSGINYHSPYVKSAAAPLYRYVQRLDGFVAAQAAYTGGTFTTKPFRFQGGRLELNIDTGAVGYAQAGFVDESGKPIQGFSVDQCIYINGDFISTPVEWLGSGTDVSALAGKTVRLVVRMRSAKLFAMQFTRGDR